MPNVRPSEARFRLTRSLTLFLHLVSCQPHVQRNVTTKFRQPNEFGAVTLCVFTWITTVNCQYHCTTATASQEHFRWEYKPKRADESKPMKTPKPKFGLDCRLKISWMKARGKRAQLNCFRRIFSVVLCGLTGFARSQRNRCAILFAAIKTSTAVVYVCLRMNQIKIHVFRSLVFIPGYNVCVCVSFRFP